MTVVAWDESIIAVDSLGSIRGTCFGVEKYATGSHFQRRFVLMHTGEHAYGLTLQDWYIRNPIADKFPAPNEKQEGSRLIVANVDGVFWYEGSPLALRSIDKYMAFGSGMDFAIGAMAHGANAIEAVAAACKHDDGCGGPIVAFNYRTGGRIQ